MAKTLMGVIYDTQSLAIRRIVIPDDDSQLPRHVGKGESLATAPLSQGADLNAAYVAVRNWTGREPPAMADVHAADQVARAAGLMK